ncbi:GspH/FimT family pseudopilin [Herbaspirillum sp. RV1423]|uniref:GspH/FimT family pseudopilin n=1 Tax=Herbaspirillum sp. RV1423 TaxID=1443993 RepID=UPI0004BAE6E6|nr:GspH/FimT family pseudopilin [Herbaspirillum sp. RV1423]
MTPMMHERPPRGFTLPELLIVFAIVGVLLAAGMPSFRAYTQSQRLTTTANEFLGALHLARSEAIQRGSRVDLAPRDGNDWESGWLVFVNKPGDGNLQFDAGDLLIYSRERVAAGLRIATTLSDKSAPYIAYNGNGRTRTNLSDRAPQWGSWQFSLDGETRLVRLGFLGRARICNPADDRTCIFAQSATSATN